MLIILIRSNFLVSPPLRIDLRPLKHTKESSRVCEKGLEWLIHACMNLISKEARDGMKMDFCASLHCIVGLYFDSERLKDLLLGIWILSSLDEPRQNGFDHANLGWL